MNKDGKNMIHRASSSLILVGMMLFGLLCTAGIRDPHFSIGIDEANIIQRYHSYCATDFAKKGVLTAAFLFWLYERSTTSWFKKEKEKKQLQSQLDFNTKLLAVVEYIYDEVKDNEGASWWREFVFKWGDVKALSRATILGTGGWWIVTSSPVRRKCIELGLIASGDGWLIDRKKAVISDVQTLAYYVSCEMAERRQMNRVRIAQVCRNMVSHVEDLIGYMRYKKEGLAAEQRRVVTYLEHCLKDQVSSCLFQVENIFSGKDFTENEKRKEIAVLFEQTVTIFESEIALMNGLYR
jgi:hypothetical protein